MNKQELINVPRILFPIGTDVLIKGKIVSLKVLDDRFVENVVKLAYGEQIIAPNDAIYVKNEPETGHADEAPRYVKNILARLRELPLHDREIWLKAIMGEFEKDFSHAKWREGYEQGKFEGEWAGQQLKVADKIRQKLKKPVIPQFVADWIERSKQEKRNLRNALNNGGEKMRLWFLDQENYDFFGRAWLDGYEVEEEKRYVVKFKGVFKGYEYLNFKFGRVWTFSNEEENEEYRTCHTKKELKAAGFGWVFDCPGVEIEEVE
ncbi:DUF1642 domain-containing protein [Streptococcus oralis]|uniref:DUF1642 domain-containing protein n=1 Tax=Streptococcus oralis TaxID=1303 RepID=UPI002000976B|nr:DUF1642 domain-containing protein [Streptococcus oralis]